MRRGYPGRSPAPSQADGPDPRSRPSSFGPVASGTLRWYTGLSHHICVAMPADGPDQVRERSGDRHG